VRKSEGFLKRGDEMPKIGDVKNGDRSILKCSEVMILGEKFVLSLIYVYVAVCRYCAVRCLIIICFYLLFSNYSIYVF